MSLQKLKEQIKSGEIGQAYRFFGEEEYLKNHYLGKIKEALVGGALEEFNYAVFDEGTKAADAMRFAEVPPMMCESKMAVLKDTGLFTQNAPDRDMWAAFFRDLPDYICVVALEEKADKRLTPYKEFAKHGMEVEFKYQPRADVRAWAARHFRRAGKEIGAKELEYLLDCCGRGMTEIRAEIEKIIAFLGERGEVTRSDIEEVTVKTILTKEYMLTDAFIRKNAAAAFKALSELEAARGEPVRILSAVASSFLSVLKAKTLLKDGVPPRDVIKRLGIPVEFIARKNVELAQSAGMGYLSRAVALIKKCDYNIKNGVMEGWAAISALCAEIMSTE